ncbi:hypothetical protein N7510_003316 [Penicillium lagena]|uniref:uncharacterized protein n=1 Tax=Penicillium lagena TaxID=94218 RepID=UPI0025414AF5|nr:uncharacterized protein N7510_003316 [Penicillium lagena]KAJ5619332.1 hypothetical protein N7510_003316 [Penicillium lagena]
MSSLSTDSTNRREVLPKNVKPVHYDLKLEPNFEAFTYNGTILEDTNSITLNIIDLKICSTQVHYNSRPVPSASELSYNKDRQTVTIHLQDTIHAGGMATLTHIFIGTLSENIAGFYRSSFKGEDGSEQYMAVSQMEPTDARRAFPCFDEPALKATFTITLVADKKMTCLSNMDEESVNEVGTHRKAVKFNKSPLMSTYLVAFVVGELNSIVTHKFRVPIRCFVTPGKDITHGHFSLELAARTLDFYERKFEISYPLPKMDMIAVPNFIGAMENWGLTIYREGDLLLDPESSSASTSQRVAEVVQHELAHQWFGNLVTMDFWDGLWLNESFATWMTWYSCDAFYPEWRVWQTYVTNELQRALALDSLRSSHPIEVPVERAHEISQIFDAITYSKGSCVLRMISKFLGEEVFLDGIRVYLKKHAYGSATTGDLWAALSEKSGKDVGKLMRTWTKNIGYPVLTVMEDAQNNSLHIKQTRFLITGDLKSGEDHTIYPVFLNLRTQDGVHEDLALSLREQSFEIKNLDFFKLNAEHSGIYRTSYSSERLRKLGESASKGHLTIEDRAGMVADAGALAAAGYQKTSSVLSLLQALQTESEFVVWSQMIACITSIRAAWVFCNEKTKNALESFQRHLVSAKAQQLGWAFKKSDTHIEQQFKSLLFESAALAGDQESKNAAFDMFAKFKEGDRSSINPNLRAAVFAVVLSNDSEDEYNAVLDEFRTVSTSDGRDAALGAIGQAHKPELIQRTLKLMLSKEIKQQDIHLVMKGLRVHRDGIVALWGWLKQNWDTVQEKLSPGLSMLSRVSKLFFEEKDTEGFDRTLRQSFDAIRAKGRWLERDMKDVEAWLHERDFL